ncbi:MAG: hypothetical protein WCF84_05980 [Anaerolineae bacterium]
MAVIGPVLQKKIAANPRQSQNLIVRVIGDMETAQQQLLAAGFQIRRKLSLINGFATTAPGASVRAVADQSWVKSIEEDQPVHTM